MTELALQTPLSAEQKEFLENVKFSANCLMTVINDILDFSKIEAGKLSIEAIPFNVRSAVADVVKSLSLRAHEKHVEREIPDYLRGDSGRIGQILTNLIGNSIKFTEEGEIFLSVGKHAEQAPHISLHFAVSDTGIGFPIEKQKIIFKPFLPGRWFDGPEIWWHRFGPFDLHQAGSADGRPNLVRERAWPWQHLSFCS
jgi:two-component system, sensor histidine kinase and response regulator